MCETGVADHWSAIVAFVSAEQSLSSQCEQQWQKDSSKDRVQARNAPLELVTLIIPDINIIVTLISSRLLVLHHSEVEDSRNEHINKWAHYGHDDDPEVCQDIVRLAVSQRDQDYNSEQKV